MWHRGATDARRAPVSAAPHTRPTARHPSPRSGQYLHGVLPQGDHLKEGHLCGDGHFPLAVLPWRPPSPAVARPAGILAPRGCSLRLKPEEDLTGLPPHTGSPMSRGRARRVQQPPHAGLHRRGTGPAQGALSWESTVKTNTAADTWQFRRDPAAVPHPPSHPHGFHIQQVRAPHSLPCTSQKPCLLT